MLEVRNLGVRYGRHIALDGVSVTVEKGEICVILGANGAGKSSLLKAIAGMVRTDPGTEIVMNGKPIAGMKPHLIVEEGIALVPEGRGIFGDLTVAENLQLGAFAARARDHEAQTLQRIYELFPRLAERRKQIARTMSGGEQQMVAIGRALMSRPDILMLDEPSLGLSPLLSKDLFKSLASVAATGVGILLVEQNARLSLRIAQRGYLMENGLVTGEDTATALMSDPAVVSAYLGGAAAKEARGVKKSGIRLPAPFALPSAVDAISRLAGKLAERAGRIHAAFIRALRRSSVIPSAFEDSYDPRFEPDPWDEIERPVAPPPPAPPAKPQTSDFARNIADEAGAFAERAGVRLRDHLQSQRSKAGTHGTARPQPAAHAPAQPAATAIAPTPSRPDALAGLDIAALASRAEARLREQLQSRRSAVASPQPVAVQPQAPAPQTAPRTQAERPAIDLPSVEDMTARAEMRLKDYLASQRKPAKDHVEAEERAMPPQAAQAEPSRPRVEEDSFSDMTARADQRLKAHLETQRQARSVAPAEARHPAAPAGAEPAAPSPVAAMAPSSPIAAMAATSPIAAMAAEAEERMRAHLRSHRDRMRPAGPEAAAPEAGHDASADENDIDALARRAGERLRRHMSANRDATLTARVRLFEQQNAGEETAETAPPSAAPALASPLVGHNSQGVALLDDADETAPPPARAGDESFDLDRIAARAAAIQAAYLEARRKRLTVFTFSPDAGANKALSGDEITQPASQRERT